jgi:UDP-GlcNAc:undecaprenyl-phosphate GlcNAc-1-phosphate transferase
MTLLIITMSAAFIAALALTPLAKRLGAAVGAMDRPGGRRRVHVREVPRLGGIAIFFPVMVATGVAFRIAEVEGALLDPDQFLGILVACGAIFLLGLYDDIRGAYAATKFSVQLLAAAILYVSGTHIARVSTPFGESLELGIFGFPVTLLWLVGLSNAMNLLDGIDGLAVGVSAMGALTIVMMAVGMEAPHIAIMAAALLGALLGFLPYNFNPASIFLGDCGALFLGFFLATLPILGSQKAATAVALLVPILSLGIPIFDTTLALTRRLAGGRHPFQADRRHLHHRLLDRGLNQRSTVLILYAVSAVLSALAIFMTNAGRIGAFLVLVAVGVVGVVAVRRLGLEEFRDLARKFRHGERRRRPPRAKAILVRNSIPILLRADTRHLVETLMDDIRRNLDFSELVISMEPECKPAFLSDVSEIRASGSTSAEDLTGSDRGGCDLWTAKIEILPPEEGNGRSRVAGSDSLPQSLGVVYATKPTWMRRRQSDNDLELLTWLADGLGVWLSSQRRSRAPSAGSREASAEEDQ